jgi:hypothetical protein
MLDQLQAIKQPHNAPPDPKLTLLDRWISRSHGSLLGRSAPFILGAGMAGAVGHALLQGPPALLVLVAAEEGVRRVRVQSGVAAPVVRPEDNPCAAARPTHRRRLRAVHAPA